MTNGFYSLLDESWTSGHKRIVEQGNSDKMHEGLCGHTTSPMEAHSVALHGSPMWIDWGRTTIKAACKKYGLNIDVIALPEALTPASLGAAGHSTQIILLLEEPTRMIARRGGSFSEALRAAVTTAASAYELARRHGATAIEVDTEEELRTRSLIRLVGAPDGDSVPDLIVEVMDASLATSQQKELPIAVEGCLAPLIRGARVKGPTSLRWPREVFLSGDNPGTTVPQTFEIAGAARVLTYGPYFPLPTGRWLVSPILGFSHQVGTMPFLIEIVCESIIHRAYFEARRAGIFSMSFELDLAKPGIPLEFRLVSQDSALEGLVALIEVGFESNTANA